MEGIITRGTTLRGSTLNEGDRVDISSEDFNLLSLTGDIRPIPENSSPNPEPESESPKTKKKK